MADRGTAQRGKRLQHIGNNVFLGFERYKNVVEIIGHAFTSQQAQDHAAAQNRMLVVKGTDFCEMRISQDSTP